LLNGWENRLTRAEKIQNYIAAQDRITSVLENETNPITVMAFTAAILKETFPDFYWVGFLLVERNGMTLGPFQGPPACIRLSLDSPGVCGTCYRTAQPVLVPDVTAFQGRVGCDVLSKSEIALPVLNGNRVMAVLDIDCTELTGLDEVDQRELHEIVRFVASRFQ
jgi:L-methionine (R)-S-oxide reductase